MEAIMANNYDDLVRNAYRYMRHNDKFDDEIPKGE